MKSRLRVLAGCLMVAAAGAVRAHGEPVLPVPSPIYWLDFSDASRITYSNDTREILTVADKSGNGIDFERRSTLYDGSGSYTGPTYVARSGPGCPPSQLPYARFDLRTNLLVQATARSTSPRTVFIVQNTADTTGVGGIWGRWGADRGIRLLGASGPDGTWQWVYDAVTFFKNLDFIISYQSDYVFWTDATLFDQRQTWYSRNWGITTAYGSHDYPQTSLAVYYETRWWAGSIGEVIVYDRILSDADRIAVEQYLKEKWLEPPLRASMLLVR